MQNAIIEITPQFLWLLLGVIIVLTGICFGVLYIVVRYISKGEILKPVVNDLAKIVPQIDKIDPIQEKLESVIKTLMKLGVVQGASTTISLLLQHPLTVTFLQKAFEVIPTLANIWANDYKGNTFNFHKAVVKYFKDAEGIELSQEEIEAASKVGTDVLETLEAIDELKKNGLDTQDFKTIVDKFSDVAQDVKILIEKIAENEETTEIAAISTQIDEEKSSKKPSLDKMY